MKSRKIADRIRKQYKVNMMSNSIIVSKVVNSYIPKPRYLTGFMAKPFVFLHPILSTKLFDYIMLNYCKRLINIFR